MPNGYLYTVFIKLGFTDFAARTAEFVILRPAKNLLAGLMILSEDQFAVGDTISVDDTGGMVEDVNLLRTRVRADDGKVWFIANGEIRKVANASLGWSRATVDLQLPYETDLDAA